jgi:hypothetical protein
MVAVRFAIVKKRLDQQLFESLTGVPPCRVVRPSDAVLAVRPGDVLVQFRIYDEGNFRSST